MKKTIFQRDELILDVLNLLAYKVDLNCTDLVLLNNHFSAKESRKMLTYLAKKQLKQRKLSKKKCVKKLLQIKPDIANATVCVDQLKSAFDAEGRFPDILNK